MFAFYRKVNQFMLMNFIHSTLILAPMGGAFTILMRVSSSSSSLSVLVNYIYWLIMSTAHSILNESEIFFQQSMDINPPPLYIKLIKIETSITFYLFSIQRLYNDNDDYVLCLSSIHDEV